MTRSKKVNETTTLAILKNVKTPPSTPSSGGGAVPPTPTAAPTPAPAPVPAPAPAAEEAKENKKHENKSSPEQKGSAKASPEADKASRYNIFPRGDRANLPCAQYKTDKGYRCPNCMRCYNARKNLVRHVTLECGREPQYKCPHCAYSKHRRNELKKHIEKKHPEHHAPDK